ncbi:MAG: 1-acyl-sn-glycerol-3-phosphate acyltransferase [Acidobacteriota bacterium]|nr:1-acyl-sn-glycerol-3-phosphate acyltransferase [Acidobacteriota bacterium]
MARPEYQIADDPALGRWLRRAVTVPGYILVWLLFAVLLLPLMAVTALVDLALRAPLPRARFVACLFWVTTCDMVGLGGALVNWLTGLVAPERATRANRALQVWWAKTLFAGGRLTLSMKLELDGDPPSERGHVLVLARHCSLADTILPIALLPYFDWRYVLKRELLLHPCLDIVGQRLPTAFVRRGLGQNNTAEIARVARLGPDLGHNEAVGIFPEGTRFTPERRAHLLERLVASGDAQRRAEAEALTHTLPPRPGGVMALLDTAPRADVLILSHSGLENAARLADVWRGRLVGRTLRVKIERFSRDSLPDTPEERRAWLAQRWQEVDRWIEKTATS